MMPFPPTIPDLSRNTDPYRNTPRLTGPTEYLPDPGGAGPRRLAKRWEWILTIALLSAYAVMSFTAALTKGVSFDEGQQLAVGYNIWLRGDYRIEGANGDLIKRWSTLPYLVSRPDFVGPDDPTWRAAEPYELAHRFFFEIGNRPETLLWQGRAMITLLGIALGFLIWRCSRELFGPTAALISLGLFAFSPNMLAFGAIVSTDLSITVTLFAAVWCIWRLLHEITWGRLAASLGWIGLLLLAKLTALVIIPITAVLLVVRFTVGPPLLVRWRSRSYPVTRRHTQTAIICGLIGLHIAAGWTAIWAHYGFRFPASPDPGNTDIRFREITFPDGMSGAAEQFIGWSTRVRFLPEGFCRGVESLMGDDDQLPAYMRGKWKHGGWRSFFPYTIWVKTQPTLFVLLALGGFLWWQARRRVQPASERAAPPLYAATPHLALIVVYLTVAAAGDINLGHRHVLPIYPSLYIIAGAVAIGWRRRAMWGRIAIGVLLGWRVVDSLQARPNYLAYFGPQAGGSEEGHKHLVDSSLDWGMNLPALKRWLDRHNPGNREPVFLAYFGTDSPEYYGIKSQRLPGFIDRRPKTTYALTPGYYIISATLYRGVYSAAFGPWNPVYERVYQLALKSVVRFASTNDPAGRAALLRQAPLAFWENEYEVYDHFRFGRLCAWLRQQGDPPHQVGHAIFIWKLTLEDLHAAVVGPPVEMKAGPPAPRRMVPAAP